MEFGAREMMIALGALVVLAIMLDVVRRVRSSRYEKIHMPRRKQPIFDESDENDALDEYGSELPSGGARVISYRDEADVEQVGKNVRERAEANKPKLSFPIGEPEQSSLNLDEPQQANNDSSNSNTSAGTNTSRQSKSDQVPVASVVVLHLMAKDGDSFPGDKLLEALLKQGLRYGSMKIFHRHEQEDGAGPVIYSVANSVNPGIFDLNNMDQLATPGVSLFYAMEDVSDPAATLDSLLTSAKAMATELGGEVKDESRSAFTRQTEDHYRQRIADFSRAQLSGVE